MIELMLLCSIHVCVCMHVSIFMHVCMYVHVHVCTMHVESGGRG